MDTCAKCSATMPNGAKFCGNCGTVLGMGSTAKPLPITQSSNPSVTTKKHLSKRGKKFISGIIGVVVLVIIGFGLTMIVARNSTSITIADANVEQIIRDYINKPTGNIYIEDLHLIYKFPGTFSQIYDITPLKWMTNMETAFLNGNNINNIMPLQYLMNLQELYLDGNDISDITPLQYLTNLQLINLSDNNISDITPLKLLTSLQGIALYGNPLTQDQIDDLQNALPHCIIWH